MRLTKKRAIKLHRELWDWLYHHPRKDKDSWPRWKYNGGDVEKMSCNCPCCEYITQNANDEMAPEITTFMNCALCPVVWPKKAGAPVNDCVNGSMLFSKWCRAKAVKTIKKYAALIRDLPERK